MGFLDKIFGSKAAKARAAEPTATVLCPIAGKIIPLEMVPDKTFAAAILGPGCGIEPEGDTVCAPFDGTVTQLAVTLHAISLMSDSGVELLIHIGMDTLDMQGRGFESLVAERQHVDAGTPLLKVDWAAIRAAGHPATSAVIVTNSDEFASVEVTGEGSAAVGAPLLVCKRPQNEIH